MTTSAKPGNLQFVFLSAWRVPLRNKVAMVQAVNDRAADAFANFAAAVQ
jgi:hypothetical protein